MLFTCYGFILLLYTLAFKNRVAYACLFRLCCFRFFVRIQERGRGLLTGGEADKDQGGGAGQGIGYRRAQAEGLTGQFPAHADRKTCDHAREDSSLGGLFPIESGKKAALTKITETGIITYTPNGMEAEQMKQCMDAENLHRRLKKIIGQVQAIDRMVDEDVPCEDVLAQINAAKSALHGCGKVVLEGHIKHCVRDGIEHGDADKTIESFTKAVERFSNMG